MKNAILVARILLGAIFVLFGINYFVPFLPMPESSPEAGAFFGALVGTGYMMPLIKITEIVGGAMLLLGAWVPLGLILLAPIVVNILAFHVFLDPAGLPLTILVVALQVFLARAYWSSFAGVLKKNAQPG